MSSDQGRSFAAFWAFLMSAEKQEELAELVQRVRSLLAARAVEEQYPLELLKPHLVEAGARVQRMTHRINEELRYFLDERSRHEGRRVAELVETVRRLALEIRDRPPSDRAFLVVEGSADIDLVMERPLFEPQAPVTIAERPSLVGQAGSDPSALFDLDTVDLELLSERIRTLLRDQTQVSLAEITRAYPVTRGLAELLGYFSLAARRPLDSVATSVTTEIVIRSDRSGRAYHVSTPDLVFLPERGP
jgi:hypothetical protein